MSENKVVYSVESYIPKDKTPQEQYGELDSDVMLLQMRQQVLMELYDETHERLVKTIAKMDKLAEKHPELKDWD